MSEMEKAESAVAAASIKHREKLFSAWKQNNFQEVKPWAGFIVADGKPVASKLFAKRDEAREWTGQEKQRALAAHSDKLVPPEIGRVVCEASSKTAKRLASQMVAEVTNKVLKAPTKAQEPKRQEVKDRQMSMGF